jgi:hypothetical protein
MSVSEDKKILMPVVLDVGIDDVVSAFYSELLKKNELSTKTREELLSIIKSYILTNRDKVLAERGSYSEHTELLAQAITLAEEKFPELVNR